jgi:hypothetical protein
MAPLLVAELEQREREADAGAHVGPRLEKAPEMPVVLREAFRAEREFARLGTLGVKVARLLH